VLYEHVNRFPRAQRGLLGRVILDDALQMLVSLTVSGAVDSSLVESTKVVTGCAGSPMLLQ